MKATVIKIFKDKETKKLYKKIGMPYEGDRAEYLQQLGYVEIEKPQNDSRLEGNVDQVKEAMGGLEKEELEALLAEEKENKNRKGVVEYIEQLHSAFGEGE